MSIIFGVQIFMNKNIKIYIILKTKQNSSQAHHIKRQNQNLEEKHCRFRSGGSDLQSLQNQLLFYLVLKSLITCIRFYLLNLRCHYYVFTCKYYKYSQPVKLFNLAFVLNFHCILYSTHSTQMYS